jgi:hypothetical protein
LKKARGATPCPPIAKQSPLPYLGAASKPATQRRWARLYSEDALLRIIDQENPPSKPRDLKGREAIAAYYDDVCGRAMSHRIEAAVATDEALSFTQRCTYPDGAKVFCAAMLELKDGRIVRQTSVQAWDS